VHSTTQGSQIFRSRLSSSPTSEGEEHSFQDSNVHILDKEVLLLLVLLLLNNVNKKKKNRKKLIKYFSILFYSTHLGQRSHMGPERSQRSIYVKLEKASLNRGGGLGYHLLGTYNATLSLCPRSFQNHSHVGFCDQKMLFSGRLASRTHWLGESLIHM